MMRRSTPGLFHLSWQFPNTSGAMSGAEGPPGEGTPVSMNQTSENPLRDAVNEYFPLRIRGHNVRPDVPHKDTFTRSWWMLDYTTISPGGELIPWAAYAPAGSFRFRKYSSKLDKTGSSTVKSLRLHDRAQQHPSGIYSAVSQQEGHGAQLPPKEMYLSRMAGYKKQTASLSTLMDRHVFEHVKQGTFKTPRQEQFDVGRIEPISAMAGQVNPDASMFPFRQKTEDFYEYAITQARQKRFEMANGKDSEVTYKIVISSLWDHHLERLAEDLISFLRDVGRQVVEGKLHSIRSTLDSLDSLEEDGATLLEKDKDLLSSFNTAHTANPFNQETLQKYDADEVTQLVKRHLEDLERVCLDVLGKCNNVMASQADIYNTAESWPHAEHMEPWTKMVEYWAHNKQDTYTKHESSTKKVEFRRYFRVIKLQMPFHSPELEKRLLDTKHWLHRGCQSEYHTIYKRNVIHDFAKFCVERDPAVTPNHEYHRLLSFAFDWQNGPPSYLTSTTASEGETWEGAAARLGCPVGDLQRSNPQLLATEPLKTGASLVVPPSATKRVSEVAAVPRYLEIRSQSGGEAKFETWAEAADAAECDVKDLMTHNAECAAAFVEGKGFPAEVTQLVIPGSGIVPSNEETFAVTETVFETDTFESISDRLGCSVDDLKAANPGIRNQVTEMAQVSVPPSAKYPRRLVDPWLRPEGATAALMSQTVAEADEAGLPKKLPTGAEDAHLFPDEFNTVSTSIPKQPKELNGTQDWLSYTARYLDKKIDLQSAQSSWNVNPIWPAESVPGKREQTPFEEDFTWLNVNAPLQMDEMFHKDGWTQDLHDVNNEQFDQSLEWKAP